MRRSTLITAASLLVSSVAGLPVRRQSADNANNLLVLKFANVLEQLETQFYCQALQKFQASDFTAAGFSDPSVPVQQFTQIQIDESTHTSVLESAIQSLGDSAISGCSFDFSSVLTDVATMASVARLVENVGVGAYLGAAHLVTDPIILTSAASIVTVEARHQSILNVLNGGTAIPAAFDLPLRPEEVLALAGSFISGCSVGIDALPPLKVTNTGTIAAGTSLTFSFHGSEGGDTSKLSCQMLAGGQPFSLSLPFDNCVVPQGLFGPVAIYVTNDTQPLVNNPRDRFIGNIVAGPTMAFLDGSPESLSSLAKSGSAGETTAGGEGANGTEITSTSIEINTISPEEASAIIESASATATPAGAEAMGANSSSASGAEPLSTTAEGSNQLPSTANTTTGPSKDGNINVDGWTFVPPPSSST